MQRIIESFSDEAKQEIIAYLIEEGYGSYANRLKHYKFIATDFYHGYYIAVAAMFPSEAEIVINPGLFDETSVVGNRKKVMDQLSVVIRHELLHFLLVHQQRLTKHIEKTDPDLYKKYTSASIGQLQNIAGDYDISATGYDDEDKQRARLLTINGEVVGGLILEDDHPDWVGKSVEELFDILKKEHEKNLTTITLHKKTHSAEYTKAYNDVMTILNSNNYSDDDLDAMLQAAANGEDIIDPISNSIILAKGN